MLYRNITKVSELDDYIATLDPEKILWVDTETNSLRIAKAKIWIVSMHQEGLDPVAIFLDSPYFSGIPMDLARERIDPLLENYRIGGHNFKYDWCVMAMNGFTKNVNLVADTILLAHLWDTEVSKNLEATIERELGIKKKTFEQIVGFKWNTILKRMDKLIADKKVTRENSGEYAAADVYYLPELYSILSRRLRSDKKLWNLYTRVELPLVEVLVSMQLRGILIDRDVLAEKEIEVREHLKELEYQIYEEAGYEFNINSPKQKGEVLFEKMRLPTMGKTPSGTYKTDESVLKALRDRGHRIAELLIEYSENSKILGTYLVGMQELIDDDGRIRGSLNQTGARTLRFSSSDPNLQNIASDDKFGIRSAFVASPGHRLVITDYSAQEYAIAAHACGDENMLRIFEEKGDIHQWVADMCGITRKAAKAVGFGIFYGLSITNLASLLKVSEEEANDYMNRYYNAFPRLRPWKESVEAYAIKHKMVRTPVGSVRRFPNIHSFAYRNGDLRKAVNTSIQGSAAVQVKRAMVLIHQKLKEEGLPAYLVLSVHDEIGVDCPLGFIDRVCEIVQDCMENAIPFRAKFWAEPNVVNSYGEGKDDKNNQREQYKTNPFILFKLTENAKS